MEDQEFNFSDDELLSREFLNKVLLDRKYIDKILFTANEPTLNKNLKDSIKYVKKLGCLNFCSIFTSETNNQYHDNNNKHNRNKSG